MKKAAIASGYTALLMLLGGELQAIALPEGDRVVSRPAAVLVADASAITTAPPRTPSNRSAWDTALGSESTDGVWLYPEDSGDDSDPVLIYPDDRTNNGIEGHRSQRRSGTTTSGTTVDAPAIDAEPPGVHASPDAPASQSPVSQSAGEASSPRRSAPEELPTGQDETEILIYPEVDDADADSPSFPEQVTEGPSGILESPTFEESSGFDALPPPRFGPESLPESLPESSRRDRPSLPVIPEGAIATSVQVEGVGSELQQVIRDVIQVREGQSINTAVLEADQGAIAATGLFETVDIEAIPNANGVDLVYRATPITVRSFHLVGSQVLPTEVFRDAFNRQVNQPISPRQLNQAADQLDAWYVDNGYTLSMVVAWLTAPSGRITVEVSEPTIGAIDFEFLEEGSTLDEDGETIEGRTRQDFIRRELSQQPGDVFNQNELVRDLEKLLSLGVFQDASIELLPDETADPPTVDVLYRLEEGFARSVRVGGGISTELGLFGAVNYRDRNFRGLGEDINLGLQAGGRGLEFNTGYTSPYRESRPNRLGYSINGFRRSNQSLTFSDEVPLANGDEARERRFGGGASIMRPLGEWDAELGLDYARVSIRDEDGDIAAEDALGNSLTASGTGIDDLLTLGFRVTQDRRLNPNNPAGGSILSFGTEQSIPIGSGNILMNRLTANYARYVPTDVFGTGSIRNPEVLAFNVRGGTVVGELPPYDAFDLGGANSVRGYGGGDVGSGRSFFLASAEYRFPIVATFGGVLFADFASDLGTGSSVEGDPAGSRDKPGTGFGYGLGLRFGSPIGLLRADFGFNDQGDNRFHFGFGQRF
jgi:outer membrane protein insertion porin family